MFERRLYYYLDWALILAIGVLCAIGIAMIRSTTSDPTGGAAAAFGFSAVAPAASLGLERIAGAAHGLEITRIARIGLDLPP